MRICREITTKKLIEMQSAATPGTLIKNAVLAGFAASAVEELVMTPTEWVAYITPIRDAEIAARPDPNVALKTRIDIVLEDTTIPQKIRDVLTEWKTKL